MRILLILQIPLLMNILMFTNCAETVSREIVKMTYQEKSCLNVLGKEVDWFVVFLYPETSNRGAKLSYGYFDDNSLDIQYHEFQEDNFPGIRVIEEYDSPNTNYMFWNDDMTTEGGESKSASSGKAHSKGGLVFNKNTGILFSHSLPRFPTRTDSSKIIGSLPSNAGIYGQTFICVSIDKVNAMKIVETLNIIIPPLTLNVNSDMTGDTANPLLDKLIKNRFDSKLPSNKLTEINSIKGQIFHLFSKSRTENNLPYDFSIPQYYQDGLYVSTWTKPDQMDSICNNTDQKVINVINLQFGNFKYNRNQEHSKWAVGIKKDFCCFGDLNRTESQKKRGGNVICFINSKLANIMRSSIVLKEVCPENLKLLR